MKRYTLTYCIVVDAEDEEEATETARELLSNPKFEPTNIEVEET